METRQPEAPLDVQFTEQEEKSPGFRKGLLALFLACVLVVPVVFYMAAVPAAPAAASAVEVEEEEEEPPAPSASSPRRAPGGRSSGGGSRSFYREAGDISDIFCRPRGEETEDAWRRRVPLRCIDNYQPSGRR